MISPVEFQTYIINFLDSYKVSIKKLSEILNASDESIEGWVDGNITPHEQDLIIYTIQEYKRNQDEHRRTKK